MRRMCAVLLSVAMIVSAVPLGAAAKQSQTGGVQGVARDAGQQPLANHTVQIRNVQTGRIAGSGATNAAGQFTFSGLPPGTYVVEIVNAAGEIVGTTIPISVTAGAMASATVTASAAGALAAANGAGFSIFGLSTAASTAIIFATAVGITVGVVAAKDDASPSR